ncbi:hypothetical protein PI124_g23746 [Phytophthora idaei]|nr:hypothetical protein PI124_g23746 [Phytophthora idaei]
MSALYCIMGASDKAVGLVLLRLLQNVVLLTCLLKSCSLVS